jgi:predicted TIM-barrel fold metal-dependent hydrolase
VFGPIGRFPYVRERQYTPPESTLEDYIKLLDHLGIERTVLVQPSIYGTDNAAHEDAVRRMKGRARGVAVVDADVGDGELARLHDIGFRGVRFNLIHTGGSTALAHLETLARRVTPLGWHVQLYLRGRILPDIETRLVSLPTDIVIDHLGHMDADKDTGQAGFKSLLRLLDGGRCWVKLCPYRFDPSGFPYAKAMPFARALNDAAPERLVWGTDWPHPDVPGAREGENGPMPDDGALLDALGEWFSERAAIERILVANPARLYGFGS